MAIHRGIMFLVGGFVTVHRSYCEGDACGDVDAGGYREYLSDVWYWDLNTWLDPGDAGGKNTWEMITSGAGFAGRGGHSLSVLEMLPKDGSGVQAKGIFALWVIGGRTGSADDKSRDAVLDDAWYALFPTRKAVLDDAGQRTCPAGSTAPDGLDECLDVTAGTWEWLNACPDGCGFPARSGHATVVDQPSESNLYTQRVYVIGGEGQDGSLLGDVWSTGWECTHDGQQAGSRTKVPTAAATDTVNEPSRGVWRGFCTSKICLEGKCEAGDPNNDINLVKTELQDGLDQDNKYCFTRKCKKTVAETVANSAQLCRVDGDCAGGDSEECVDITWAEDDEQRYVPCVAEDDCPAMATCRAKPRWRRDYDPDALFRAKVPGGAFMPESTFVEDVEGAVTGNEGEYGEVGVGVRRGAGDAREARVPLRGGRALAAAGGSLGGARGLVWGVPGAFSMAAVELWRCGDDCAVPEDDADCPRCSALVSPLLIGTAPVAAVSRVLLNEAGVGERVVRVVQQSSDGARQASTVALAAGGALASCAWAQGVVQTYLQTWLRPGWPVPVPTIIRSTYLYAYAHAIDYSYAYAQPCTVPILLLAIMLMRVLTRLRACVIACSYACVLVIC